MVTVPLPSEPFASLLPICNVLVLLIDRQNIKSGVTTIAALDHRPLGSFTLTHAFDAALVEDARVYHGVTAVEPVDPALPAHRDVLVAFLGYALQVTLKQLLKRSASEYSPAEALKWLAEIRSVDIVLPTVEGREIWMRRVTKLDEQQQRILHQLRLQLPERLEPIQIQKCSADSAIA